VEQRGGEMLDLSAPRSTASRDRALADLARQTWDLVIVGGGASGAAAARDAALRGLSVALVEQADLAHGTSSRSSRLIHGGLRYLAEFELPLVREGLVERRRLLAHAPGLVREVEFLYPVFRGDPDPLWKVNLGVALYELLALGYGLGGRRRLAAAAVSARVPALRSQALRGAVLYRDAATHDARLTLALAVAAARAGALIATRTRALGFLRSQGRVTGLRVEDRVAQRTTEVRARSVLVCSGPWQDLFAGTGLHLRTARGSHLSVPRERLSVPCCLALRAPRDGRLVFAIPNDAYTVLGTTDAFDPATPGEVTPAAADVAYLLEFAAHAFPGVELGPADVVGAWSGLRPLISSPEDESADKLSREHRVASPEPGLWILTGGKLTTHRAMAEECLDRLASQLATGDHPAGPCRTRSEPLLAGELEEGRRTLDRLGLPETLQERLSALYGARLEEIAAALERECPRGDGLPERLLEFQIAWAVREEWALTLDDLLLRRLLPGALDLKACRELAPRAARAMAGHLGWSASEEADQVRAFAEGVDRDLGGVAR
jgi:glycerol-3-phosphate dehydrogenase